MWRLAHRALRLHGHSHRLIRRAPTRREDELVLARVYLALAVLRRDTEHAGLHRDGKRHGTARQYHVEPLELNELLERHRVQS